MLVNFNLQLDGHYYFQQFVSNKENYVDKNIFAKKLSTKIKDNCENFDKRKQN